MDGGIARVGGRAANDFLERGRGRTGLGWVHLVDERSKPDAGTIASRPRPAARILEREPRLFLVAGLQVHIAYLSPGLGGAVRRILGKPRRQLAKYGDRPRAVIAFEKERGRLAEPIALARWVEIRLRGQLAGRSRSAIVFDRLVATDRICCRRVGPLFVGRRDEPVLVPVLRDQRVGIGRAQAPRRTRPPRRRAAQPPRTPVSHRPRARLCVLQPRRPLQTPPPGRGPPRPSAPRGPSTSAPRGERQPPALAGRRLVDLLSRRPRHPLAGPT